MAAVSMFWDTNMAAVTSCENTLLLSFVSVMIEGTRIIGMVFPRDKIRLSHVWIGLL